MNKLTRNQVSTIIQAKSRMLDVKLNYKNKHTNLDCRLCNKEQESQKHILEECENLKMALPAVTTNMIFTTNVTELKKTAKIIEDRMEVLEKKKKEKAQACQRLATLQPEPVHID